MQITRSSSPHTIPSSSSTTSISNPTLQLMVSISKPRSINQHNNSILPMAISNRHPSTQPKQPFPPPSAANSHVNLSISILVRAICGNGRKNCDNPCWRRFYRQQHVTTAPNQSVSAADCPTTHQSHVLWSRCGMRIWRRIRGINCGFLPIPDRVQIVVYPSKKILVVTTSHVAAPMNFAGFVLVTGKPISKSIAIGL